MKRSHSLLVLFVAIVSCDGPQGPTGPGAEAPISYVEFPIGSHLYDDDSITLEDPRILSDRYLGLFVKALLDDRIALVPLTYPAAVISARKSRIADMIQVVVTDGKIIITDGDREIQAYATGFARSSGATEMLLVVALLASD